MRRDGTGPESRSDGERSLFHHADPTCWFVICDTDLRGLLARAQAGESPDLLLIEFYANTKEDDRD